MPKLTDPSAAATVAIAQARIDDLHRRLDQVRWPHRASGAAVPGFDTDRLRPLVEHWRRSFDWRTVEARLENLASLSPPPPTAASCTRCTPVAATGCRFSWSTAGPTRHCDSCTWCRD